MARKKRNRRRRAPIVVHKRREASAAPGTIAPPPGAPPPRLHAIAFGPDTLVELDLETLGDLDALGGEATILWLDIVGVGDARLFKALGERFALHPLALEDVVNLHQRPKAEEYDDHAYLVVQMPVAREVLALEQVSLFLGERFVVTVQEQPGDCLDPVRERLRKGRGRIRRAGADYLLYTILDVLIDSYFPVVERLNLRLEELEETVVRASDEEAVTEIHVIRHDLHVLRRSLAPTRDAVAHLRRTEGGPVAEETRVYLRDCQDHVAQLLDAVEACRELSAGLMELHLSGVSNRMNEVMKVLTVIATIFMPLGFIAGVYGMNFDLGSPWNMPELRWRYGYPFALGLMLVTAVVLVLVFRRRGWTRAGRVLTTRPTPSRTVD